MLNSYTSKPLCWSVWMVKMIIINFTAGGHFVPNLLLILIIDDSRPQEIRYVLVQRHGKGQCKVSSSSWLMHTAENYALELVGTRHCKLGSTLYKLKSMDYRTSRLWQIIKYCKRSQFHRTFSIRYQYRNKFNKHKNMLNMLKAFKA